MNADISNTSTNMNKMNVVLFSLYNRTQKSRYGVGVQVYSFFNLGNRRASVQRHGPGALHSRKKAGTH